MARNAAYRKYQLTFNNPLEHGFPHEVIKTTLTDFSNCVYWCMCDEIGEQQTPHTHLYVAFKNAVEFSAIHQHFYGAHIESAKGTHRENRDYIRKEGKWRDDAKHETNLPDTFEEWGELPPESDKRESQSAQVLAMLDEGADNETIVRAFPTWMKNIRSLDTMRQTLLEGRYRKEFRKLSVWYLWGKTGVGKTRTVMERYGYKNVYRVTNYTHPFDSYRGEPVLMFEEFRGDLPTKDMLKYLDGYPLMLPCRYGDKVACFTSVFLVSNIPIAQQYPNVQNDEPETWRAFLRRFESGGVFELLPDCGDMPF